MSYTATAIPPWEWHAGLFKVARSLNMEIFLSPFDETTVDFLESLDVAALVHHEKNGNSANFGFAQ